MGSNLATQPPIDIGLDNMLHKKGVNSEFTILIVDDEEYNLQILKTYLEDTHYKVIEASDGIQAMEILESQKDTIDLVLLDRMMPNMSGMECLEKMRSQANLSDIPVIMQTAAAGKSEVVEGIRAGVYYYLTKPFEEDMLMAIVQAALTDYYSYKNLCEEVSKHNRMVGLVTEGQFEYATVQQAHDLATYLAHFFPDPEKVILGLSEMMINAVEHGNLGIGYEHKSQLLKEGTWQEEIEKRQEMPEYKDKRVHMCYKKNKSNITLTITDEGEGFAWEEYMEISSDRATDSHGRGIALANLMSFDKLEYVDKGNSVHCHVNIEGE